MKISAYLPRPCDNGPAAPRIVIERLFWQAAKKSGDGDCERIETIKNWITYSHSLCYLCSYTRVLYADTRISKTTTSSFSTWSRGLLVSLFTQISHMSIVWSRPRLPPRFCKRTNPTKENLDVHVEGKRTFCCFVFSIRFLCPGLGLGTGNTRSLKF